MARSRGGTRPAPLRRCWEAVKFPPPYDGALLSGRLDGAAYLLGWVVSFAHLGLAACVLVLGLPEPWPVLSAVASGLGSLVLLTVVIVIHRRLGHRQALPRSVVWQWWLGPWDPVGRLVWLPVRLGEAARAVLTGADVDRPGAG